MFSLTTVITVSEWGPHETFTGLTRTTTCARELDSRAEADMLLEVEVATAMDQSQGGEGIIGDRGGVVRINPL